MTYPPSNPGPYGPSYPPSSGQPDYPPGAATSGQPGYPPETPTQEIPPPPPGPYWTGYSQPDPGPGAAGPADQRPEQGGYGAPPPPAEAPDGKRGLRGWHVAVVAVVALLLGIGLGAAGGSGEDPQASGLRTEVDRLRAELDARDGDVARLTEELRTAQEAAAAAEADAAAAREELAAAEAAGSDEAADEEPAPDAAEDDGDDGAASSAPDGEYAAGSYTFTDVQVAQDFIGGFDVRARMTNTGSAKTSVGITATLFSGGSVVGTATGLTAALSPDQTITLEMFSVDQYTSWDEIEFQVEYEF